MTERSFRNLFVVRSAPVVVFVLNLVSISTDSEVSLITAPTVTCDICRAVYSSTQNKSLESQDSWLRVYGLSKLPINISILFK